MTSKYQTPKHLARFADLVTPAVNRSGAVYDSAIATRVIATRVHDFFLTCAMDNCANAEKKCEGGCELLDDWKEEDIVRLMIDQCVSTLQTMDPKHDGMESVDQGNGFRLIINPDARRYFIRRFRGDS